MTKRKLKPPKRLRWHTPRVCWFCKWFINEGTGSCYCQRDPEGTTWDTGDAKFYQQVCNRFSRAADARDR